MDVFMGIPRKKITNEKAAGPHCICRRLAAKRRGKRFGAIIAVLYGTGLNMLILPAKHKKKAYFARRGRNKSCISLSFQQMKVGCRFQPGMISLSLFMI